MISKQALFFFVLASWIPAAEAGEQSDFKVLLQEVASNRQSDCDEALFNMADLLVNGDSSCELLFNDVTNYLSQFEEPDIDLSFSGIDIDFGIPDSPSLDLSGVCDAGKCISRVTDALADVDQECTPSRFRLLTAKASFAIKAVRAFVSTLCVKDNNDEFCLKTVVDSIGGWDPTDDDEIAEVRETMCSPCSLNLQRDLFAVLDVPENLQSLSQLACLRDPQTEAHCPGDDLAEGVAYAFSPGTFVDPEDLCDSPCKLQAAAVSSTLFVSTEFPDECHENLDEASCVLFSFEGLDPTEIDEDGTLFLV